MDLIHGGDVVGYRMRYGRPPLDFSASLNPFGMPPAVRKAARQAVDDSVAYPDPLCRRLVLALAERLDVPETFLFCGNGAADVIYRYVQAIRPRTALVTAPTFAEYERALASGGCRIERHLLREKDAFAIGNDILGRISPDLDVLFVCQPNNPIGRLTHPDIMAAILERTAETGTLLFVDECFLRFVDNPERHSLVPLLSRRQNLFVLDSFTKLYGMAGVRLGYGICSEHTLIEKLSAAGQPWAVSTVAQAAGVAALGEMEYVEKTRRTIRKEKQRLVDGLKKLPLRVIGDEANYVFFHTSKANLDTLLAEEGIMIRNCANFPGLRPGYFRVSVRLEEENDLLLGAMARALTY